MNCDVTGRTLSNCAVSLDLSSANFEPEGIIVKNGVAYTAQSYDSYVPNGSGVQTCTVGAQNQFTGCTMYGTTGPNNLFAGPPAISYTSQIAMTSDGSVLYVNSRYSYTLWSCSVSGSNLSGCTIQQTETFEMTGIALNAAEDGLYVSDYTNGAIYLCPANGLTVGACTLLVDLTTYPDLSYPWGLTIV